MSRPWHGSQAARRRKFRRLHEALCRVYGVRAQLVFGGWYSRYWIAERAIHLAELSVVTYLHEFAHARGWRERQACRWSINLFRRVFPREFARCRRDGHVLRKRR